MAKLKEGGLMKGTLTVLQIILSLSGTVALVIATSLSLVQITALDNKIDSLDGTITKLRDGRIGGMVAIINYGKDFVFRRIELLERNIMVSSKQSDPAITALTNRILENTAKMAKQWSYWYGGDQAASLAQETNNKIQEIYKSDLSPLQKIDAVEVIWKESIAKANGRLQEAQERLHAAEKEKEELEKKKQSSHNWFVGWQLGGLIFLALAGVIEAVIRLWFHN